MSNLERLFPLLSSSDYHETSPKDNSYNCIAWAAGTSARWWEPDQMHLYYWPPGVQRRRTLDAYAQAFAEHGYERCSSAEVEPGFDRVAIFVARSGIPTHAARQLASGRWTSKLGELEDIEHDLGALEGGEYGTVALIMKRRCEARITEPDT